MGEPPSFLHPYSFFSSLLRVLRGKKFLFLHSPTGGAENSHLFMLAGTLAPGYFLRAAALRYTMRCRGAAASPLPVSRACIGASFTPTPNLNEEISHERDCGNL